MKEIKLNKPMLRFALISVLILIVEIVIMVISVNFFVIPENPELGANRFTAMFFLVNLVLLTALRICKRNSPYVNAYRVGVYILFLLLSAVSIIRSCELIPVVVEFFKPFDIDMIVIIFSAYIAVDSIIGTTTEISKNN